MYSTFTTLLQHYDIHAVLVVSVHTCTTLDDDDASKITSDELSVFYRDFLHRKYEDQMSFTR